MIEFHAVMPLLRVSDLDRSPGWCLGILGFELIWREPGDGDGENAMLRAGNARVLLSTGSHLENAPSLIATLYFEMSGVDGYYFRVRDRVELSWPLEDQPYRTRVFGVRDPYGYMLAFSQESPGDGSGGGSGAGATGV